MPTRKINSKGFAHLLLIIAGLIFFGTASAAVIPTTQEFPQQNNQSVLGEDEEVKNAEKEIKDQAKEEEKRIKEEVKRDEKKIREDEKKLEEIKKEEIKKIRELDKDEMEKTRELQKINRFSTSPNGVKEKIKISSKSGEEKTEVETADGQKFKTRLEKDGRFKFEIENNNVKIRFENGKLKIKRENEGSGSGDLDDEDIEEIEDLLEQEFEDEGIEIASSSGGLIIKKNKVRASTRFPLSINPETNEFVVTTPAGQKVVTILPDQAVENMLSKSILSDVDEKEGEESIEIEIRSNELVYKVKGEKNHKFLGFIPLRTAITAFVSANTGELTAQEQSLLSRIINILSS